MERRRAMRVPVRGVAVCSAQSGESGTVHATIANLSASGALFLARGEIAESQLDVELKLGLDSGWLSARTVRVERLASHIRIAVVFERVEPRLRASIDAAIEGAIRAAERRPVLVVDDQSARRHDLVAQLAARGMTPLAPRTPLEAIDLLARSHLHINVALLAPSFGQSSAELRALFAESFPWVTAHDISNDINATVEAAASAWSSSEVVRLATAIA